MDDFSIINELIESSEIKLIKSDCKKLVKKFSKKSSKDLGVLAELVTILYVYEKYDDLLQAAELVADVEFTGNYTLWDNIVSIRLISIKVLKKLGKHEEANKVLKGLLPMLSPHLYVERRESLKLFDQNIEAAKRNNWSKEIMGWTLIKYEELLKFSEMPGFPINKWKLEREIKKMTEEVKVLLT